MKKKIKKEAKPSSNMKHVWSVLFVVLGSVALFSLGVFNTEVVDNKRAVGFTQLKVSDFKLLSDGNLYLNLKNNVGEPVLIKYINATIIGKNGERLNKAYQTALGIQRGTGEINMGKFSTDIKSGEPITVEITVGYVDEKYEIDYTQYGTLSGVAK